VTAAHLRRHAHRLSAGIVNRHRVVEHHHQSVAGEALDRALEFVNDDTDARVIFAQEAHHLLRLRGFGEGGESAQVAKDDRDLPAMAFERAIVTRRQDQFGHLRRQEALQAVHAPDLRKLLLHALFQRPIPAGQIGSLRAHLVGQLLHPEHRFDAGNQRGLIDRLGQIFVGAGVQSSDHVLGVGFGGHQDDGGERQIRIRFQTATYLDAIDLRHHDVEQNKVGTVLADDQQSFLAIGSLQKLVAVRREPRAQNIAIGLIVIDDENTRGIVHRRFRRGR
jgi:hypothetical protein